MVPDKPQKVENFHFKWCGYIGFRARCYVKCGNAKGLLLWHHWYTVRLCPIKWGCVCVFFQATFATVFRMLFTLCFVCFLFQQHNEDNVIFVVQENHIFGSLHDADHGKFSIKPCPYNETCHVLMQKMPWSKWILYWFDIKIRNWNEN